MKSGLPAACQRTVTSDSSFRRLSNRKNDLVLRSCRCCGAVVYFGIGGGGSDIKYLLIYYYWQRFSGGSGSGIRVLGFCESEQFPSVCSHTPIIPSIAKMCSACKCHRSRWPFGKCCRWGRCDCSPQPRFQNIKAHKKGQIPSAE